MDAGSFPGAVIDFVHETDIDDIPADALHFASRSLLDLLGVAAAGRGTALSRTICDHACRHFGAGDVGVPILFDGRIVSPPGAALAAGMTIDSIDAHDGHNLTKGHTGCHQLPALIAVSVAERALDPRDFLASLVVGYEFATRAGIALHASALDYHTSGAWGAVGAAALGARLLHLDHRRTFEAMGIAEYHGPRSQMMRVIDHPTMLKDGSGWGAMAGVSAAYLAADGFTGAPAITVSAPDVADVWSDLGSHWIIADQYYKPHPVCRWAQPAVEAALELCRRHDVVGHDVVGIEIATFHEAARLATPHPASTEEAQYSLPFPVAAAVSRGRLGAAEIIGEALTDPEIRRLASAVRVYEDELHNEAFPSRRYARLTLELRNGDRLASADTEPRGDANAHLSDAEIRQKFHALASPAITSERAASIEAAIDALDNAESLDQLFALILRA